MNVGAVLDAEEDDRGLKILAQFDDDAMAQKVYRLVKAGGLPNCRLRSTPSSPRSWTTPTGPTRSGSSRSSSSMRCRWSPSEPTPRPRSLAIKAAAVGMTQVAEAVKAGRTLSKANESSIRSALEGSRRPRTRWRRSSRRTPRTTMRPTTPRRTRRVTTTPTTRHPTGTTMPRTPRVGYLREAWRGTVRRRGPDHRGGVDQGPHGRGHRGSGDRPQGGRGHQAPSAERSRGRQGRHVGHRDPAPRAGRHLGVTVPASEGTTRR